MLLLSCRLGRYEYSAEAGPEEEEGTEVDQLLEELMDLYKEKHGEDPTDEIVQNWLVRQFSAPKRVPHLAPYNHA